MSKFDEIEDFEEGLEESFEANQELYERHSFVVDPGQSPLRVDRYLANRIENASRNKVQQAVDAKLVLVNNLPVRPNYKVKPNDKIVVLMTEPPREIELVPQDIPVDIVFEDDHFVIVNKKPGMVVHPAYGNYTGTLVNALAWHFKDLPLFNTGDARPGLVHRIDKNTSGILVVAKNEEAKNKLGMQFYNRTTDRKYIALVWGSFKEESGTITGNIGRHLKDRKKMDVFPDGDYGKPAITHFKVLEDFSYVSVVECKLETGRTHQIRAHFKHIGHPLFNDDTYGGDAILKGTTFTKYKQFVQNCFKMLPRQALHAKSLALDHPVTGERMFFDSEIPEDMATTIDKWRYYIANR